MKKIVSKENFQFELLQSNKVCCFEFIMYKKQHLRIKNIKLTFIRFCQ